METATDTPPSPSKFWTTIGQFDFLLWSQTAIFKLVYFHLWQRHDKREALLKVSTGNAYYDADKCVEYFSCTNGSDRSSKTCDIKLERENHASVRSLNSGNHEECIKCV
jgi:hypothetical protein